ncbi:MAG: type I DNA topoisomerase [Patescibacteria group bacterium]
MTKALKHLIIVESPSKAKTIGKYLGDEYIVMSSVGHIRDLPKNNKKAIDIENDFKPNYEISAGKEKVVRELEAAVKKVDSVYLAADHDREGEAIAWHVQQTLKLKDAKRITYTEITKEAILEAIAHPRKIDQELRHAQEARRVLDRLVGYDLSGLIWKKVRYGLSAGRVQSPALRIIMEREREIRAFVPEAYYTLIASLTPSGTKTTALGYTCVEDVRKVERAEEIVKQAHDNAKNWYVKDIESGEVKRSPKAPFITSTIQQVASTRLGFSPSRTMRAAQKLYEHGHITYMRTDSTNLGKAAQESILGYIKKVYGAEYVEARSFSSKVKNAQEAHEAIRPTNIAKASAGNTDDEKRLYDLILARTISSQMSDAKTLRTKIVANVKGGEKISFPDFTINGSRILFDGWLKADPVARGEDVEVPALTVGNAFDFLGIESTEKFTEPPGRYTEAGLVKELEKRGIGRPSTYASIMRTLEEREYVEKLGRALKPTDVGDVVSTFLEENFEHYISDSFTAEMEDKLDLIAEGKTTYEKVLGDFYKPFLKEVKLKSTDAKITNMGQSTEFVCPLCGSAMDIKLSRGGKFLSCSKFPECLGSLTIDGVEIKADEPIGTDPETGMSIYVKNGRFGPFVQLGEKTPKVKKPRMASIPKEVNPSEVTVEQALLYLSLPRVLGKNPANDKDVIANKGRFGPYVGCDGDFRSLKNVDVFKVTFDEAMELLNTPKKPRGFAKKKKAE